LIVFDRAEYLERLARTKQAMAERGIEVLLVSDPCNINYLSGYDAWSFYVGQLLFVALDEEEPLWVGRGIDANAAKHTVFMGHERIIGYPDHYVQSGEGHPMHAMAEVVRERGWERRTLGVEKDSYYFSAHAFEQLLGKLPNTAVLDAGLMVNWLRVGKSEAEIELMRQAGRIAERAMTAAIETIAPGVRECDVAAAVYHAQMTGTEEFGGHYTSCQPFIPSGPAASAPHLPWTDQPHQRGRTTTIELCGCRHRYHAPLSRTVHLGEPPAELRRVAEAVLEGLGAALDAVKPGISCAEVEAVWRKTAAKHGVEKESRIGYSIGIGYPPTIGERTLSLRPGDETLLRPNMTLHLIPGIWRDDWGVVISESIRVTETGHETFCDLPRGLVQK
jgi:Xaa-Pro dipeptidase